MQGFRIFTMAAGVAAFLGATGAANAQQQAPPLSAPHVRTDRDDSTRSQVRSDRNIQFTRAYVEKAINRLQRGQHDYGGHRVAAIAALVQARGDLRSALNADRAREDMRPLPVVPDLDRSAMMNQNASNETIENSRAYIEKGIDMLQGDAGDYGGYRLKAIADLQRARAQLDQALQYVQQHPDRDGNPGQGANLRSDSNIQMTRGYLERAIDMLNTDQRDYAGHRAAAVRDLGEARVALEQALRVDMKAVSAPPAVPDIDRSGLRIQSASNENLEYVNRYVQKAMQMLQADAHDYGGYRVKAIADLHRARAELNAALRQVS